MTYLIVKNTFNYLADKCTNSRTRPYAKALIVGLTFMPPCAQSALAADELFSLKGMVLGMALSEARQVPFPDHETVWVANEAKLGPIRLACNDDDMRC